MKERESKRSKNLLALLILLGVFLIGFTACGKEPASQTDTSSESETLRPTGYFGNEYPQSKLRYNGDLYEFSNPSTLLPDDAVFVGKISATIEDGEIPQNDCQATNSKAGRAIYLVTDHDSFLVDKDGNMTPYTYLSVECAEGVYLIYYRSSN